MTIFDAHLDLSYNALRGRDVRLPAARQRQDPQEIPTVGLPDLAAGGVGMIAATIFCMPSIDGKPGYHNGDEAHAEALRHLEWYQRQVNSGRMMFMKTRGDVAQCVRQSAAGGRLRPTSDADRAATPDSGLLPWNSGGGSKWPSADGGASNRDTVSYGKPAPPFPSPGVPGEGKITPLAAVLLLEGADALRTPDDIPTFVDAGMRAVGLAWKQTRAAGGTGAPGPLTSEGVTLVKALDRAGIIHDASHLAEESFWQLLDTTNNPVMASHSNCRARVPTDRQLSDDMIKAIAGNGGVIGINFFDRFLMPPEDYGKRRAALADVVWHVRHICDLAGDCLHVGLGTDMDGGLGREQIPQEIITSADLPKVGDALMGASFSASDVNAIMGGNWVEFFAKNLPGKG